ILIAASRFAAAIAFDRYLIGSDAHFVRIEHGSAGPNVKLPTVPGASQDIFRPVHLPVARAIADDAAGDLTLAQGCLAMGTDVPQGIEVAFDVEHADADVAADLNNAPRARRELAGGADGQFAGVRHRMLKIAGT